MEATKTHGGSTIQSTQYDGDGTEAVSIEELVSGGAPVADPAELERHGFCIKELGILQVGTPMEVMADIRALLIRECCPEGLEKAMRQYERRFRSRSLDDLVEIEGELKRLVDELTCERHQEEHRLSMCLWRKEDDSVVRDAMTQIVQLLNGMRKVLHAVREHLRARLSEPVMANV